MFFYLYDSFVLDKNYASILNRIESRVIEFGINGRVEKLTPLRNMKELLEQGIASKAHTIVVVGNDNTFVRALNVVAAHSIVLGYIPVENTTIGRLCGITDPLEACNVLSRRITKTVPLLKVNQNYALLNLVATLPQHTSIRCDDLFTLASGIPQTLTITSDQARCSVTLQPQPPQVRWFPFRQKNTLAPTVLQANKISIHCQDQSIPVLLDETVTIKTPVTIQFKTKAIRLIVGKGRTI